MFIDYAKIHVVSGDGGKGCVSFRREKFVPRGGPDGGDGGNGGDVIIKADPHLHTLYDIKYKPHFKAGRGAHGKGKQQHGKNGKDVVIRVPCGTLVKTDAGDEVADMTTPDQQVIVAHGGKGGRGNVHFASSIKRAPRIAEPGEPGVEKWLILELKMLADVGLVGFPNAGKSTFLAAITPAHPKIAAYPFTTLHPNLGVYVAEEAIPIVFADIPGVIEQASKGVGLGDRFLRHIERTRLLVFILFDDMGNFEWDELWHQFSILLHELEEYSSTLLTKKCLIAINKIDLAHDMDVVDGAIKKFEDKGFTALAISAKDKIGLQSLLDNVVVLYRELGETEKNIKPDEIENNTDEKDETNTV